MHRTMTPWLAASDLHASMTLSVGVVTLSRVGTHSDDGG